MTNKNKRPMYWMPRNGDVVDYHSVIGGPVTTYGHLVEYVGVSDTGYCIALISEINYYVDCDNLTPHDFSDIEGI